MRTVAANGCTVPIGGTLSLLGVEAWPALRPEWEQVHASSEAATFFLSATWVDAWLDEFAAALRPVLLRFEVGGAVTGVGLISRGTHRRGGVPLRRIYINTAGEGKDSPMLEHNRLLCPPAHRSTFAAALAWRLKAEAWDELALNGVRRGDYQCLAASLDQAPATETWREAPYVDLTRIRAAGASYLDTLSRNSRYQIRRSLKRYASRGPIRLDMADSLSDARAMWTELVELHQRTWTARGRPGAFASPRLRRFHERIIETGLPRGEVQLMRISTGSDTVGVLYNLVGGTHVDYYQSGLRYEDDQRLKPGLVCHALAIEHTLKAGYAEYDFLAAANDGARYKRSLSNATRHLGWITFERPGFRTRLADASQSLKQRLTRR